MTSRDVQADDVCPAAFLNELWVAELPNGRKRLLEDLVFYSAELQGTLTVPAGFVTNYASVPWGVRNTFPQGGPWKYAATLHDAAYAAALVTSSGQAVHCIKRVADALFHEAMTVPPCDRVPRWQRWLMYTLVKRFGGRVYGGLGTAA